MNPWVTTEIFVASPDGAYTTVNSVEINYGDDDVISIGETINMTVEVENIGSETASEIELLLSNTSPYIQITDNNATITNLDVDETATVNLTFVVSTDCPY